MKQTKTAQTLKQINLKNQKEKNWILTVVPFSNQVGIKCIYSLNDVPQTSPCKINLFPVALFIVIVL